VWRRDTGTDQTWITIAGNIRLIPDFEMCNPELVALAAAGTPVSRCLSEYIGSRNISDKRKVSIIGKVASPVDDGRDVRRCVNIKSRERIKGRD
jgi:hypothetical protein